MAKKKSNNKSKSFKLRGANNWETMLNTLNVIIGWVMTLVWGTSSAVATGAEASLDLAPKKIGKAIHKTATKGDGLMDTWDSFMAEDSSDALADTFHETKNKWLGDRTKAKAKEDANKTKHLDKAIKALPKADRKDAIKAIKMAKALVDGLTDEKISKLVKKHGVTDAMLKVQEMMANA